MHWNIRYEFRDGNFNGPLSVEVNTSPKMDSHKWTGCSIFHLETNPVYFYIYDDLYKIYYFVLMLTLIYTQK